MATRLGSAAACGALVAYSAACLALDSRASPRGDFLIGVATWLVLTAICLRLSTSRRLQAVVVVAVATCVEATGALVWGTFRYRLGGLPLFVPPGHALVFLTGVTLSRALPRPRTAAALVLGGVALWAIAGVTLLSRADWGGALGVLVVGVVLVLGRETPAYSGIFLVVTALELFGTAIGSWTWASTIPGTGIPNGDPPSGAAAGYLLIDVAALALASRLSAAPRPLLLSRYAGGLR